MRAQSRLTIDLSIIQDNYRYTQSLLGESCVAAGVVKANAYGLGVEHVVPALEAEGCPLFFVATPLEGQTLRAITAKPIALLNPYLDDETAQFITAHNLMPVLNSLEDLSIWAAHCAQTNTRHKCVIQLDTGMRRVGLNLADIQALHGARSLWRSMDVHIIMSHFASADELSSAFTKRQYAHFCEALKALSEDIASTALQCLSNSAGTIQDRDYHFDLVRPGRTLAGMQPIPAAPNPNIQSPVTMEGRVLQFIDVKAGESIGYNETYRAEANMRVATISMGYADGVRRGLSNIGHLMFEGHMLPITGRVSMDMVMVQIDHLGDKAPQRGDWVQYLNATQTPDHIAGLIGTNGYEILTGLGKRAERIYIERCKDIKTIDIPSHLKPKNSPKSDIVETLSKTA